jgi:hypothetical protein
LPAEDFFRLGRSLIIQLKLLRAIERKTSDVTVVRFEGVDSLLHIGREAVSRLKGMMNGRKIQSSGFIPRFTCFVILWWIPQEEYCAAAIFPHRSTQVSILPLLPPSGIGFFKTCLMITLSIRRFFGVRLLCAAFPAVSGAFVHAFPPAPHYTIYGMVRDQVGQAVTAEGAEVILLKGGVEIGRTPIFSNRIDQNYELNIRIDQAQSGTAFYSEKAVASQGLYSLVVEMNGALFYPIEVSGTLRAGKGGERVKLDLMAYANYGLQAGAVASQASADLLNGLLKNTLKEMDLDLEEKQLAYEMEAAYRDLLNQHFEFAELIANPQGAEQKAINLRAEGDRILAEREVFRQRAAAVIQGYRTNDLGFGIFRNEALEQYRSLFDLASRYSYLAAKSYDYETGLLGTSKGQEVFGRIIASRSLGDLSGGVPQSTVSTLGDAGLAGTMAQLSADFSVAEGRLGINNRAEYGTVFSLRSELFRLLNDPSITSDDDAWQQTIERHVVTNVLGDSDVANHCRITRKPDGSPIPGIIIPFNTTIQDGKNLFGLDLAGGDHAYTSSNFSTKICNVGIAPPGYVGMDNYATGNQTGGPPTNGAANSLSATPYAYLIPCGSDYMLAPPLGDNNILRAWQVKDQALPLPYNLGANDFNSTKFFNANGTLGEQPWILRKHQAFRMVSDANTFYSSVPAEFTNSRLIGRSVWNSKCKLVIPANTLSNNEQAGLNRFTASVKDIQHFLRTYSNSGN